MIPVYKVCVHIPKECFPLLLLDLKEEDQFYEIFSAVDIFPKNKDERIILIILLRKQLF